MTIEVAKQRLLNTAWLGTNEERETTEEAVRVLIKAVEQQPKTAIKAIKQVDKINEIIEPLRHLSIDEMSNIEWDTLRVIDEDKALEQEPCEDAISRQYLIDIATKDGAYDYVSAQEIANAPPVKPQEPKTGKWIEYPKNSETIVCNQCKGIRRDNRVGFIRYCNRCGAKMEG